MINLGWRKRYNLNQNDGNFLSVFVSYAPEIKENKTGRKMIHEIPIWMYSFVCCTTKSKILQIYHTIYMRWYMFRCEKLQYSSKWPKKYKKDTDKI